MYVLWFICNLNFCLACINFCGKVLFPLGETRSIVIGPYVDLHLQKKNRPTHLYKPLARPIAY